MKIHINRHFIFRKLRLGRLFAENGGHDNAWVITFGFGNGAGYINGFTAYIAGNCQNKKQPASKRRNRIPLQIGITTNANHVPYADGTHNLVKHATNFGAYT